MIRTTKEIKDLTRAYDAKLSASESAQANRYRWYGYTSLALALISALIGVGLGTNIQALQILILPGIFLCILFLGLMSIFLAKEGTIRKYLLGSSGGRMNSLFGESAVKSARYYSFFGYCIIAFAIATPLIVFATILAFPN